MREERGREREGKERRGRGRMGEENKIEKEEGGVEGKRKEEGEGRETSR